jgi:hypothetical protein
LWFMRCKSVCTSCALMSNGREAKGRRCVEAVRCTSDKTKVLFETERSDHRFSREGSLNHQAEKEERAGERIVSVSINSNNNNLGYVGL